MVRKGCLTLQEERGRRRGWALASAELCSGNLKMMIWMIVMIMINDDDDFDDLDDDVTCKRHQVRRVG